MSFVVFYITATVAFVLFCVSRINVLTEFYQELRIIVYVSLIRPRSRCHAATLQLNKYRV